MTFFLREPFGKRPGRCKGDVPVHRLTGFGLEDVPCSSAMDARLRDEYQAVESHVLERVRLREHLTYDQRLHAETIAF